MKRIVCLIVLVLMLIPTFASCSYQKGNSVSSLSGSTENKKKSTDIVIQSPMTLSNNDLFPINGEHQYLRLKMIKGKYY